MLEKLRDILKKELVLVIASSAALLSLFFVPPSAAYLAYIDFSVLAILFCLMAVVAGFLQSGFFDFLSEKMLRRYKSSKKISAMLVLLCFFSAMLITNDVALITFVPLSIKIFGSRDQKRLVFLLVLETIAANLGSMLTPIGNPQNLYLYSFYDMNIKEFLHTVFPVCAFGLLLLLGLLLCGRGGQISLPAQEKPQLDKRRLCFFGLLFALCIATVLRLVDYRLCLLLCVLALACFERKIFAKIDYALLATFVAFFIFVGNLGRLPVVEALLSQLLVGRELLLGVVVSQVISNVPAAIMLSGFTDNARALLLGVNIGGLGTLIASLASLIAYKLYAKSEGAKPKQFLGTYMALNPLALGCLCLFTMFLLP